MDEHIIHDSEEQCDKAYCGVSPICRHIAVICAYQSAPFIHRSERQLHTILEV